MGVRDGDDAGTDPIAAPAVISAMGQSTKSLRERWGGRADHNATRDRTRPRQRGKSVFSFRDLGLLGGS
jgi:hypothetical protein